MRGTGAYRIHDIHVLWPYKGKQKAGYQHSMYQTSERDAPSSCHTCALRAGRHRNPVAISTEACVKAAIRPIVEHKAICGSCAAAVAAAGNNFDLCCILSLAIQTHTCSRLSTTEWSRQYSQRQSTSEKAIQAQAWSQARTARHSIGTAS